MGKTLPDPIVFVVDDDTSVRDSLARLMVSAGYNVETFKSASQFLNSGHCRDAVGCIILDVRMPGLTGMDLQRELKTYNPSLPIIFLTGHGEIAMGVSAMKEGAQDFLTKPVDDEELLSAVARAITRNAEARTRHAELLDFQRRADSLTPREREVMALIVRGLLNKQVAAELGTVEKTIKVHRARVMDKMQVESFAELVRASEKLGLFSVAILPGAALQPAI